MPEAPTRIEPQELGDYLDVMSKAVFQSGMSWKVVEGKWDTFRDYLRSRDDFWDTLKMLRKDFKFLGDFGAYYFLYVVGEDVPPHEEFRTQVPEAARSRR